MAEKKKTTAKTTAPAKVEVPAEWADAPDDAPRAKMVGRDDVQTNYLNDILIPTNTLTGDAVPVSKFLETANGMIPSGTAAFEKRGIATDIPTWAKDNCIQCNWCSYVCPHGVIRPFVLNEDEAREVPDGDFVPMKGNKGKLFLLTLSFIGWLLLAAIPGAILGAIFGIFTSNIVVLQIVSYIASFATSVVVAYITTAQMAFYDMLTGRIYGESYVPGRY